MSGSKWDETRRCMPLAEWPAGDRAAWERAIRTAGPFEEPGLAAHWRPQSRKYVVDAYGRLLTFLELAGQLDPNGSIESRLTPEALRPYLDEIMQQVAPATAAGRIRGLSEAARVMVPGVEFPHLKRARYRLKAQAHPTRNKSAKLQPSRDLAELGLKLMREAESGDFFRDAGRACHYRDGLIIVLMASRPLRRENFAAIELDRHLTKSNGCYRLCLTGDETKNRQSYSSNVDAVLTPFIDRYLDIFRPILLNGAKSQRLWIAMGGAPMAGGSIYGLVKSRTLRQFGIAINPHLFRDCAVTSLGSEKPELVWAGMSLLHHVDPRTTEKHYDHALSKNAVEAYQESVQRQRRTLTKARKTAQPKRLGKRMPS